MKKCTCCFILVIVWIVNLSALAHPVEKKIRVLIVDGFSNHDWQLTTHLIRAILEPSGLFSIETSTYQPDAPALWKPDFMAYDVVIQTCNDIGGGPQWPEYVQRAFEHYVCKGGGVYILHSANNAFVNWPAYNDIIGLGWRKRDQGTAIRIDSLKRVVRIPSGQGRGTGHGPRTDAVIRRLNDHPIHRGIPLSWKTADVEIYQYPRGSAKNIQVLSYAFDEPTQMNWPMEWTVQYGNGRVYVSSFGHVWKGDTQPVTMRCAGVQTILVRALQWLARKPVSYPVPADFPRADQTSIRPERDIR